MEYRIMDDYIQAKIVRDNEPELWINVAKIIDKPRCRELVVSTNAMERIFDVADDYFAQMSAINQKFKTRKGNDKETNDV